MMEQESSAIAAGIMHDEGLHHGQSPWNARTTRQNTRDSIESDRCIPLAPGFYKIPFHGNCPRCHHRHIAAEVKVEITIGYTKPSYVHCEVCNEKWVAVGGRNSTCISLLSTLTVAPDPIETDARRAIIDMVRSISSVASPILATVPEVNTTQPTTGALESLHFGGSSQNPPGPSVQNRGGEQAKDHSTSAAPTQQHLPVRSRAHSTGSAAVSSNRTAVSAKDQKNRPFIEKFKRLRKLKVRFQKLIPKRLLPGSREPKVTAKGQGKIPVIQTSNAEFAGTIKGLAGPTLRNNESLSIRPTKIIKNPDQEDEKGVNVKKDIVIEHTNSVQSEKIAQARAELSERKRDSSRNRVDQPQLMNEHSAHVDHNGISAFLAQHRSHNSTDRPEFLHIGGHLLDTFSSNDELINRSLVISADNPVPTSQADTAINPGTMTATSGPPTVSYQDYSYQSSRSRSPADALRRSSLRNSRFLQPMSQEDLDARSFAESFSTGGPVRSIGDFNIRRPDGFSTPSVAQDSLVDPPPHPIIEQIEDSVRPQSLSTSTSRANGYRTSSEDPRT